MLVRIELPLLVGLLSSNRVCNIPYGAPSTLLVLGSSYDCELTLTATICSAIITSHTSSRSMSSTLITFVFLPCLGSPLSSLFIFPTVANFFQSALHPGVVTCADRLSLCATIEPLRVRPRPFSMFAFKVVVAFSANMFLIFA